MDDAITYFTIEEVLPLTLALADLIHLTESRQHELHPKAYEAIVSRLAIMDNTIALLIEPVLPEWIG